MHRPQPRDYQLHAINAPFEYFSNPPVRLPDESKEFNPLIVMPTGTGKSWVVGGICIEALGMYAPTRILMLTDTKELVKQNYEKLKEMWSDAPVGIYCDGLDRKQLHYPLTFGTIASIINVAEQLGFIDLLLVDEAHKISPDDESMYRTLINVLKRTNPLLKVIGLTATPFRMKQGMLTNGTNALFTDIIVDMSNLECYNWFFEQGYLLPPIPRPTKIEYDASKVRIKGGEYDQKSMQEEVDNKKKNEAVVLELLEHGVNRHCGMVFAGGVDHCKHLLEIFEYYVPGKATWVASRGMSGKTRDANIEAYKNGEYKWMINNGILTTGFDYPAIDIMGVARLILSPGLWGQMLGRGTRPLYMPGFDLSTQLGRLASIAASPKQNCMVLDFGQNATRLGMINALRVPEPPERKRKGDAPIRICDSCGCYNHASARACWACQFEFPRYLKIEESSATTKLVAGVNSTTPPKQLPQYIEMPVDHVTFDRHTKRNTPDSIKVTYHCGRKFINEWICLDHVNQDGKPGVAAAKGRKLWRTLSGEKEVPGNVEEALKNLDKLRTPRAIECTTNTEFAEVRAHIFE